MRTDSIYRKLEKIDRDTGTTYVTDLMIFLGETEGDRFGKAVALVKDTWGFKTSKTALFEGYATFLPLWRLSFAARAAKSTAELSTFDLEAQKVAAQRMFEFLTSPALNEKNLIGFLKIQVQLEKVSIDKRRVTLLEEKMSAARVQLQELRDPKADDPTLRKAVLDRVDEIMGIAAPEMTAILPSMKIDSDAQASRYFMRHQLTWIADDSRMRLAEKSVRIGWTYGDAFKNVRKRLHHKNRDYLFATKDAPSAVEYVDTCKKFCEIYKLTKSILAHGTDTIRVPISDLKKDKGLTEEVKIGYIKFDNGSRIIAFSANPFAMQVYGGDVGLDEYARHPNAAALWETAQGRITWGYDIGVWSSHNGPDTQFNVFCQEAAAGKRGWSHYRVTMGDAIDFGLLDKIEAATGKHWTREEFLQDCLNRAGSQEIFDQSYDCQPRGSSSAIVPWSTIQLCSRDYSDYERAHIEEKQIVEKFGEFRPENAESRLRQMNNWLLALFSRHAQRTARHTLGFDVAASGMGDLAAIYIDRREGAVLRLSALLTFRTEDWNFIESCLYWMMDHSTAVHGAGDETGLGRQICWNASKKFAGRFDPVNFSGDKHDMGFALMNQMQVSEKQWPAEEKDIGSDFFALQKLSSNGKWRFSEGTNQLNPHSHCDIAWAGALSTRASTLAASGYSGVLV